MRATASHHGFEEWTKLGEGTYADVYRCVHTKSGRRVAIKRVRPTLTKDGVDVPTLRELKALQEFAQVGHPNVLQLLGFFCGASVGGEGNAIHMALELCPAGDLQSVIEDRETLLSPADVKSYMRMALAGLRHCHAHWVLHLDLKPANLLIGPGGQLKLADFGLARLYAGERAERFSPNIVTLPYRAPELLFGAREYDVAVDMWAMGAIFAELMLQQRFFSVAGWPAAGWEERKAQLVAIFQILGTPTGVVVPTDMEGAAKVAGGAARAGRGGGVGALSGDTPERRRWPAAATLPAYAHFAPSDGVDLARVFPAATPAALDLLDALLMFDPARRADAKHALASAFFAEEPVATAPAKLAAYRKRVGEGGEES